MSKSFLSRTHAANSADSQINTGPAKTDPEAELKWLDYLAHPERANDPNVDYTADVQQYSRSNDVVQAKEPKVGNPAQSSGTWDHVTDTRIGSLDPRLQGPATQFINRVESELGIQLRVTSAYRSFAEQNALYAKGRNASGNIVTNAKGGESYHNYGLAFDVVVMQNGQCDWSPLSKDIANIAIDLGFDWGGNWRSFKDYPHFEMTFGLSILQLQTNWGNTTIHTSF